jgi:transposase
MTFQLNDTERVSLRTQHKQERDVRVCDRIKAVLLYDQDWSYAQIATALLISDDSVRRHIEDFQLSRKLKPHNGGSVAKLSGVLAQALLQHLEEYTYLYIKDIVAYVRSSYGVEYTVAGMCNWLHRHGFSYKKPSLVPGKAHRESQERWIAEYEGLKQTLSPNESICFLDGVHPTHNTQLAYDPDCYPNLSFSFVSGT